MATFGRSIACGSLGVATALCSLIPASACGGNCASCAGCGASGLVVGLLVLTGLHERGVGSVRTWRRTAVALGRRVRLLLIMVAAALGGTTAAFGGERQSTAADGGVPPILVPPAGEPFVLEPIVITASRHETRLGDTPASVTVVTRRDLDRLQARSLDDALKTVAGVDISGSGFGSYASRSVTLRGLGGALTQGSQGRTLVLVDGVPLNDSWSGGVAWSLIPKEDIARVEVVRGPASSLYGSDAMGGVIQVFTKVPKPGESAQAVKATCGDLDTRSIYARASGRTAKDRIGYYASARSISSGGYYAIHPQLGPNLSKTRFTVDSALARVFYFPAPGSRLELGFKHLWEDHNQGYTFANLTRQEITQTDLAYHKDAPDGISWLLCGYLQAENQRYENDDRTHSRIERTSVYDKPFWGLTVQPTFRLSSDNTLTLGAEFKHNAATQSERYLTSTRRTFIQGKQEHFGVYAQDEQRLLKGRLIVTPGLRFDSWETHDGSTLDSAPPGFKPIDLVHDPKSWESITPRLGMVFHATDRTRWRAAVGTGFRAPSPVDLYGSQTYGALTLVLGNPDLDPETVFSCEAGIDHSFGRGVDLKMTVYRAVMDGFISSRTISKQGARRTMQKDNISRVESRGLEAELTGRMKGPWSGFANFTHNDSTIASDEVTPANVGNRLACSPPNKLNLGLSYDDRRRTSGTFTVRFVDDSYLENENTTRLDSYWTADLSVSRMMNTRFKASVDLENIFDTRYDIPAYASFKAPGRLLSFTLAMEL